MKFIAILLFIGNLPCRHYQREVSVSWQLEEASEEAREYGHLLLPITISHTIDPASPLYTLGPAQLARAKSVISLEKLKKKKTKVLNYRLQ